jgi:hypothetical protein
MLTTRPPKPSEDYGYFSARPWAYKHNTTTNAIHTLLALVLEAAAVVPEAELHVTLVTSRS